MEIKITDIGIMLDEGWLVVEEGASRSTFKLTPMQMEKLANDAIFALKKHARAKRELFGDMGKSLSESKGATP